LRGRRGYASAAGNHASWRGADCSAGTSACSREDSRVVMQSAGEARPDRQRYPMTPTSIGRPRGYVGTRRDVAVKPSHGTGELASGSNSSASEHVGVAGPLPVGHQMAAQAWTKRLEMDIALAHSRAATAPRTGSTSYGPLLRVHGRTATRQRSPASVPPTQIVDSGEPTTDGAWGLARFRPWGLVERQASPQIPVHSLWTRVWINSSARSEQLRRAWEVSGVGNA
jgi:hypothetical protein